MKKSTLIIGIILIALFFVARLMDSTGTMSDKEFNKLRYELKQLAKNYHWDDWGTDFGESGDVVLEHNDVEVTFNITAVSIEMGEKSINAVCPSSCIRFGKSSDLQKIEICDKSTALFTLLKKYQTAVIERMEK